MAAVDRVVCSICSVPYSPSYWYQHLFSNTHKIAVRTRDLERGKLSQDGIILHATSENIAYDVLFAPATDFMVKDSSSSSSSSTDARLTIEAFFAHFKAGIKKRIQEALILHNAVKVNGSLSLILRKPQVDFAEYLFANKSLRTKSEMILHGSELDEWLEELVRTLLIKYETMPEKGSNWSLHQIIDFELHISKFIPLRGSSYIPLPSDIGNKKAVINVQNLNDNRCFAYSILGKKLTEIKPPIKDLQRMSRYTEERMKEYDFTDIHFPTPLKDITMFERRNNVSVNVYGIDEDGKGENEVYPLRISEKIIENRHFDLLYLS